LSQTFSHIDNPKFSDLFILYTLPTRLWRWNRLSVPKLWRIKFRRRGITQKKA